KITYLLGVRHHGSLVRWTPFAQARNILVRYLEVAGQTRDTFAWNPDCGREVANALSIPEKDVLERLMVYRVMEQIGESPAVKASKGGMKDRYYSLCADPFLSPRTKLKTHIAQNPKTFLLTDEGVARMNGLCHFDQPSRKGAPVNTPPEWKYV